MRQEASRSHFDFTNSRSLSKRTYGRARTRTAGQVVIKPTICLAMPLGIATSAARSTNRVRFQPVGVETTASWIAGTETAGVVSTAGVLQSRTGAFVKICESGTAMIAFSGSILWSPFARTACTANSSPAALFIARAPSATSMHASQLG